jgi:hypothetical protein
MDVIAARQAGFSILAGLLFGAAWWVLIDGFSYGRVVAADPNTIAAQGYAWLPLFSASIGFILINLMQWSELQDNRENPMIAAKARIFLVFMLFIIMGSLGGAVFIMTDKFLGQVGSYQWAGISCFVGTGLITLATFVMRIGTIPLGSSEM